MYSKLTWLPFSLLAAGGVAGGWVLKTSLNQKETPRSTTSTKGVRSLPSSPGGFGAASNAPSTSTENLGDYQIDAEGRRIYVGPRDITVLNRLSELHPNDAMGQIEVIGQLSQMNPQELAEAWEEFSKNDPTSGSSSQLLAAQVFTRLHAAGIEFEIPQNWARVEKSISTTLEIDEARRNADAYRDKLLAGETLTTHQRRGMFSALAAEDPAATAQLWAENSTPEQQFAEARSLAFLMLDPEARGPLLALVSQTADAEKRGDLISDLGSEWAAQDPNAFAKWIDETGDLRLKKDVSFLILNMQAGIDPVKSVAFAQTIEKKYRRDAIEQSFKTLANHQWQKGAELISTIKEPEERQAAISGYGLVLAAKQFDDFVSWRDTLPPAEQDVVNNEAFLYFASQDPTAAELWLEKRPDGPDKEALKANLILTEQYANTDDRIELIQTISDPAERARAVGMTLRGIDVTNLEEIQRVLDSVSSEPTQ